MFVEHMVNGMNQSEAYVKAYKKDKITNYVVNRAAKLAKDARVVEAINFRRNIVVKKTEVTAKGIIERMWNLANCMSTQDSAKIQALVWLGKYVGLWGDKAGDGEGAQMNITINNFGRLTEQEYQLLDKLPGEYHTSVQLHAPALPAPIMDGSGSGGEKDSQG